MTTPRTSYPVLTVGAQYTFDILGIGYSAGYRLVSKGEFPVSPIKIGGQYRFSRSALAELLGMSVDDLPPAEVDDAAGDNRDLQNADAE